uniref:RGS domain-containing protein n=1 Tax=Electrophorus electricus TaxID=8005 RepID=A0A4W4GG11_ELEEL
MIQRRRSMDTNDVDFFPSLYDPRNVTGDIWGSLFWSLNKGESIFEPQPWPVTKSLVTAEYRPFDVFSPPAEGPSLPWSEADCICELSVRFKEIELFYQLVEDFDDKRCRQFWHFLTAGYQTFTLQVLPLTWLGSQIACS